MATSRGDLVIPEKIRNGVYLGNDGWLFLHAGAHRQFQYLLGEARPTTSSIESFTENIKNRAAWCSQRGIPYIHLLSPAKPVVMKNRLPVELGAQVRSVYERYFLPEVRARGCEASVWYPAAALQEIIDESGPYRVRDTHMGDDANLWLTKRVLERIGIATGVSEDFVRGQMPRTSDLSIMLGDAHPQMETVLSSIKDDVLVEDNMHSLQGNTGHVRITRRTAAPDSRRLLVFGDSFLHGMLKFFSKHFQEVIYLRSASLQYDIAELINPDVVVTGNTERYLNRVNLDHLDSGFTSRLWSRRAAEYDESFLRAWAAQLGHIHHPAEYESWVAGVDEELATRLGAELLPVRGVRPAGVSELGASYIALDNDPQFRVAPATFEDAGSVLVSLRVRAPQPTRFVVYGRLRREVYAQGLAAGWNRVEFVVATAELDSLRVDPVAVQGPFAIEQFTMRSAEAPAKAAPHR